MPTKQKKATGLKVEVMTLTIDKAKELVGWREAKKGEKGIKYDGPGGGGSFILTNNVSNRPFSIALAKSYMDQMLRGVWAGQWNSPSKTGNGESAVIDSKGHIVSCVHRCVALILAELMRQKFVEIGAEEKIEDLGCKAPITLPDFVLVNGVDPLAADTNDTGKNRGLADVLFRRHEFQGKEFSDSDLKALSTVLSVALRHVWLRTNGYRVKGAPKLFHAEAVAFLEKHPLLKEAALFIYDENNTNDADNRNPIGRYGFSLGYAAAHLYLAAFKDVTPKSYHVDGRDMSRKPSKDVWEKACEFWTDVAQLDNVGLKNAKPVIKSLRTVFTEHKNEKQILSRDGLCCVVTRAMLSYLEDSSESITTNKLRRGVVNSSDEPGFVPEFERFGGIDLDGSTLDEMGYLVGKESLTAERQKSDDWEVGQECFVLQPDVEPWKGEIKAFSDDGNTALVYSPDDDEEYLCELQWLADSVPEAEETNEEAEAPAEEEEELQPVE